MGITQWSARVGRTLDQHLEYPLPIVGQLHEGAVAVQFLCSDDGTPTGVTVKKSSGFKDLDYAALRSVRQIKTLHPLPDSVPHGQVFQANILFADSERAMKRQMADLLAEALQNNARFAERPREVALNIGFVTAGAR
jgi:TonB family protein